MGWIGDHLEEKDAKSCSIREVEKDKTIIQKKKRIHQHVEQLTPKTNWKMEKDS